VGKIAIVKFSRSHSGRGGACYNTGECAAFSEEDAEEIVELESGAIIEWRGEDDSVKREGIQSPPENKMVSDPIQKKADVDEESSSPRARSRRPTITENLLNPEGEL
jgi:hypothetical protein